MKINSALKLKQVAWVLGALVAVIVFIAVAHSSAKVSVQLSRLNWILRSLDSLDLAPKPCMRGIGVRGPDS
jgi:hypothetical protein